jgi:selenide,water dikinase
LIEPLARIASQDERIIVGPETADDAGVYLLDDTGLVATLDFITPVCDDPQRYGRVAAANSLSDVYAMGGKPLFVLNICCFPEKNIPEGVLSEVLQGAAHTVNESGAVLLGGHSVADDELKFGLAVVGKVDPNRILANSGAVVGDHLILTKPLGTGVLINAYKAGKIEATQLEAALAEMERLNGPASEIALAHGTHAATDITGFALVGHALGMARASGVAVQINYADLPVHEHFYDLVDKGVSTGSTVANEKNAEGLFADRAGLTSAQRELLFDPQTSGGLLLACPGESADRLLQALMSSGHQAALIGKVIEGDPRIEVL